MIGDEDRDEVRASVSAAEKRFLVQVVRPGLGKDERTLAHVAKWLEGTGVVLDETYGVYAIDRAVGRLVARVTASASARAKAEQRGFVFFSDSEVAG